MGRLGCVLLAAAIGCVGQATKEDGAIPLPDSTREVIAQIQEVKEPVLAAISSGNLDACDAQLHDAMYLADRLTDVSAKERLAEPQRQTIASESKSLVELLTAVHDGAHGATEDPIRADEFSARFDESIQTIVQSLASDSVDARRAAADQVDGVN